MTNFQIMSHSDALGIRTWTYEFCGDTIQTLQACISTPWLTFSEVLFFIITTPSTDVVESNYSCLFRNTAQGGTTSSIATIASSVPTLCNQYLIKFTSPHLKRQPQQQKFSTDLTSHFSIGSVLYFSSQPTPALFTCYLLFTQLTTIWFPSSPLHWDCSCREQ